MEAHLEVLLYSAPSLGRHWAAALACGADRLIVDLEDAVDAALKDENRRSAASILQSWPKGRRDPVVRINAMEEVWSGDDVRMLQGLGRNLSVLVPKCPDVGSARTAIETLRAVLPTAEVLLMVESAALLQAVADDPRCLPDCAGYVIGYKDLCTDLGLPFLPGHPSVSERVGRLAQRCEDARVWLCDGVWSLDRSVATDRVMTLQRSGLFPAVTTVHPKLCDTFVNPRR